MVRVYWLQSLTDLLLGLNKSLDASQQTWVAQNGLHPSNSAALTSAVRQSQSLRTVYQQWSDSTGEMQFATISKRLGELGRVLAVLEQGAIRRP